MADENRDTMHVFISYRRRDAAVVDEIVATIGDAHSTWRDTEKIRGGQVWREDVATAMRSSYAMILVVSETTEISENR